MFKNVIVIPRNHLVPQKPSSKVHSQKSLCLVLFLRINGSEAGKTAHKIRYIIFKKKGQECPCCLQSELENDWVLQVINTYMNVVGISAKKTEDPGLANSFFYCLTTVNPPIKPEGLRLPVFLNGQEKNVSTQTCALLCPLNTK